ncbi:MAG TPA: metallophosphoesterase family protein [Candidatus Omnitrophota bacterium]|nr:metallophosphoesterase family protein [Candidatus Omnitrophota bacterium]HRZ14866.1 metallophosphoesterase family protein [Candidatus Omnitrophota bacterium]
MKIGVLSDTHIPDRGKDLPRKVIEAFKGVDMIIHAGDLVDLSVVDALSKLCANVKAVSGNMDPGEIRQRFPAKLVIPVGKFKIGVMHGWGPPNKLEDVIEEAFRHDPVDVIIFGHSHQAIQKQKGKVLFFNPGSPTDTVFAPFNSCGILEINETIEARLIKL